MLSLVHLLLIISQGSIDDLHLVLAHDSCIKIEKLETYKPARFRLEVLCSQCNVEFDVAVAHTTVDA